jgi:hypothetical protein
MLVTLAGAEFVPEVAEARQILIVRIEKLEIVLNGVTVRNVAYVVKQRPDSRQDNGLRHPPLESGYAFETLRASPWAELAFVLPFPLSEKIVVRLAAVSLPKDDVEEILDHPQRS